MRLATFGSRPVVDQEPEQQPSEDRLVEERRRDRVEDRARVGRDRWQSDRVVAIERDAEGDRRADRAVREAEHDRAEAVAEAEEQVLGGRRVDPQDARIPPMPSVYQARRRTIDGLLPQRSTSSYSAALKRSASNRSITRNADSPRAIRTRSASGMSPIPGRLERSTCGTARLGLEDGAHQPSSMRRIARNASCGISTEPTRFMRCFPSFCFSSSLRLRVISPP